MKPLLKPHISEKTYQLIDLSQGGSLQYTFLLNGRVDKAAVKKTVEQQYNVTVEDVRTVTIPGKKTRFRGRPGVKSDVHKAIVRIKKGQSIKEFDLPDQPAAEPESAE